MDKTSNLKISKEEEQEVYNIICRYTTSDPIWPKELVKTKKINQKKSDDPNIPDIIDFKTTYTSGTHGQDKFDYIFRIKKNKEGQLQFCHVNKLNGSETTFKDINTLYLKPKNINESYIDPSSETEDQKFFVTKLEEQFTIDWIKKKFLPVYIRHFNSVYDRMWSRSIIKNPGAEVDREINKARFKEPIKDGDYVIKNLRKIKDDYRRRIVYFTKSSNGAEFIFGIEKSVHVVTVSFFNPWKEGYMNYEIKPGGYPGDEFSYGKAGEITKNIQENFRPDDWQSWENVTQSERETLKLVLKQLQEYYKEYYSKTLSNSYIYLLQKVIDNLDVTDPRFAAKPLSKFSMEHILLISDFVDHKDTTGSASKVLDLLYELSKKWVKPFIPKKPDIELKGITNVVYKNGTYRGNVTIDGLNDMRPVINFDYGNYTFDIDFVEQFSRPGARLCINGGQEVYVTNMPEVIQKVKEAINKYNSGNSLTEGISDDPRYIESMKKITERNKFSKQEEELIRQYLSNKIVNGIRLGKTLKKIYHQRATNAFESDIIHFSAEVDGKEKLYRVVKLPSPIKGKSKVYIRDSSYGEVEPSEYIPLITENMDQKVVLTKEDESKAVNIISNLTDLEIITGKKTNQGNRIGKTLKKVKVIPSNISNISDTVVYEAKPFDKFRFSIWKSERRGLIVRIEYGDSISTITIDKSQ